MSRIGKQPVEILEGVEVTVDKHTVTVKGPKGELTQVYKEPITVEVKDRQVIVERKSNTKLAKSMHGLYRSLINNMVEGVTKGYVKDLEIKGIGYRAEMRGNNLIMSLGYSHPIELEVPQGVTVTVTDQTQLKIEGFDKQLVGEFAAVIKDKRKVEPYKGKGIRYVGESVRRKAGKSAKAAE